MIECRRYDARFEVSLILAVDGEITHGLVLYSTDSSWPFDEAGTVYVVHTEGQYMDSCVRIA